MTLSPSAEVAGAVAAAVRAEGRRQLIETEANRIVDALGIGVPAHLVLGGSGESFDLPFEAERAVVKVLSPGIAHKTDAGGIAMVPATVGAVRAAVAAMEGRFAGRRVDGFLVAEFVGHDAGPGGEVLAGLRWTDAFGPVVLLGHGGIIAEAVGGDPVVISATTGPIPDAGVLRFVLGGFRGGPPAATRHEIEDLVGRLLAFGAAVMPQDLVEFEVNPLVFTAAGPVALDALGTVGAGAPAAGRPPLPEGGIDALLHPESIAVMGVSERANPGRIIVENVLAAGFPRERVTVVKPASPEVLGCRTVADLRSLPEAADLLVLAVGAASIPDVMEEVTSAEAARAVILIPAGLGERPGSENLAERIEGIIAAARATPWGGPVVNGGNSMGVRSVPGGYDATFIPPERMTPAPSAPAPVAVVAQSGAFTLSRLDRMPWLQPRYLITVGNQIDLTVADYVEFFAADPEVAIVACYVEGFVPGDGRRFVEAAADVRRRGGTVLVLRGGRTPAGARSVATHTAAVATDDVVARSLLEAAGVLEARSLDEFEDLLRLALLLRDKRVTGAALGAVSNAGFECVAIADALGSLRLADLDPATVDRLGALLGEGGLDAIVGVQNPLDLTPAAGDTLFADAVAAILDDPQVDLAVIGCVPYAPSLQTLPDQVGRDGSLPRRLAALVAHPTPWVAVVDAGDRYQPMVRLLEDAGVPVFGTVDRALRLLGRYAVMRLG